jgi:carbamoyltransferase
MVCDTHDSGLALLKDGAVELVLEEERFNREKHTKAFPHQSLAHAIGAHLDTIADVDVITTPWRVTRLRKTFARAIARRFPLSLALMLERSHEPQSNDIVFLNFHLARNMRRQLGVRQLPPIVNVGHHDAHAACFFVSPFEEANVLVMDGYGDDASSSIYEGQGNRLTWRWKTPIFNSLGMVYTFVTQYLGFAGFSDEGKVMALAAYGDDSYVERMRDAIRLVDNGEYAINMEYFDYDAFGLLRPFKRKFFETFGPERQRGDPLTDRHRAVARALQVRVEETVLHLVRHLTSQTRTRNLVFCGGVALNCVANARILEETDVERLWVPPCASDTGAPLGSALWHYHQTKKHPRVFELTHPFYGTSYSDEEIERALKAAGLNAERMREPELLARVAQDLAQGKIVGWFQGRFEMGPRALGNRSILADPRNAAMKDKINRRIKHREPFRPFAPAVLEERAAEFFHVEQPDPFMTLAPRVRADKAHLIPAAVHVDGTGRIQTVARSANPRYWGVIDAFGKLTGVPVLLNTSFNRQEPIVTRPEEAISCYLRTEMDTLVLGNFYTGDRNRGRPETAPAHADPEPAVVR